MITKPKIPYHEVIKNKTLNDFIITDPIELFKKLRAKGKLDNQRGKILQLLLDGEPHSCMEFLDLGIAQYNARIKELRDMGFNIINVRSENDKTYFILLR